MTEVFPLASNLDPLKGDMAMTSFKKLAGWDTRSKLHKSMDGSQCERSGVGQSRKIFARMDSIADYTNQQRAGKNIVSARRSALN
ncbi:hypothetical protein [Cupriavidus basilensis]|uniref:hypothetical protein n=1 Tax=Cupriavidus basilensis TaxID=68895 RepID=UPI0011849805|nr:hypothetical protein [Cupriavidus basilensis]